MIYRRVVNEDETGLYITGKRGLRNFCARVPKRVGEIQPLYPSRRISGGIFAREHAGGLANNRKTLSRAALSLCPPGSGFGFCDLGGPRGEDREVKYRERGPPGLYPRVRARNPDPRTGRCSVNAASAPVHFALYTHAGYASNPKVSLSLSRSVDNKNFSFSDYKNREARISRRLVCENRFFNSSDESSPFRGFLFSSFRLVIEGASFSLIPFLSRI